MPLRIKVVSTKKDLRDFIYLPEKIHKGHTNWVHPIYVDDWSFFNPKKNKSFAYCDTVLVLALKEEQVVGRIMGIIHKEYNQTQGENHARFAFVETYNDPEVFQALIDYLANWGKAKGMDKLVGPFGFSDKDPQGFLIEGFNESMAVATNCNFSYMNDLIKAEGFDKLLDLVVYKIAIPEEDPPIYLRILERFNRQQKKLQILEFQSRRKVRPYIRPALRLVNATFRDIYGFWPFDENEMHDFANRYLYLINPRFIKMVTNEEDKVIAFVVGMTDISKGIQKARGRLFPLGFLHLLRAGKKSRQLNLLMGAIHPDYQGKGLDVIMGMKMLAAARKAGKTTIDSHLEMESNTKVRAEMERLGGKVYKKYRIYQKEI
jgi:ribosomal protein S18 acetylase RimI-like enzyme